MNQDLLTELAQTSEELLEVVASFPQEDFDRVPFEGSWTAGQVTEHLEKAIGATILYGNTGVTQRPPGVYIDPIKADFLNFNIKMQSPEFILPVATYHDKVRSLATLEKHLSEVQNAARTLDLTATCVDFSLPVVGELTRLEWLWFFVFHMQRHIYQLRNIAATLKISQPAGKM